MEPIGRTLGQVSELTIHGTVRPGEADALRTLLDTLDGQLIFQAVPTIHFARFVLLAPGGLDAEDTYLLFTCNYDGPLDALLAALVVAIPDPWSAIWAHCLGWPGECSHGALTAFVAKHAVTTDLFYAAYPSLTLPEVLRALRVDDALQGFLDTLPAACHQPADTLADPVARRARDLVEALGA